MLKIKNLKNKAIAWLLILFFLFIPFSLNNKINLIKAEDEEPIVFPKEDRIIEITDQNHQWKKEDNIVIRKTIVVKYGASLIIEKGSVIKFEKEEDELAPFIYVEPGGILIAQGDEKNKIVFTSDQSDSNFSLVFNGENEGYGWSGFLRYVEISKAGGIHRIERDYHQSFLPVNFFKKALAEDSEDRPEIIEEERFPIKHLGGILEIENSRFYDNQNPDIHLAEQIVDSAELVYNNYNLVKVVNSNFENNETGIAVRGDYQCIDDENKADCKKALLLKNNWYGKTTGAYPIPQTWEYYQEHQANYEPSDMFGGKVIGRLIKVSDHRTEDLIADPVLIIPGIMGSSRGPLGTFELDPILHSYDDLRESLQNNGYQKNVNLFEFPYDWRNSNVMTAQFLADKLEEIRESTSLSYIDIVAHSMGGLVTRQYIQSDNYNYDIDQFITLGTPHHGSPKAYLQWEAGEGLKGWKEKLTKHHFTQEAEHNGYDDIFDYIQNRVLSVKELLPDYDYLYDVTEDEMRNYPTDYPRNIFLENLNDDDNLVNFTNIRSLNIMGSIENETINKIKVIEYEKGNIWEHGKPENFDDKYTDRGLELGDGDETVPLVSAKGFNAQETIEIEASHSKLPTKAQGYIFEELTGVEEHDYDDELDLANVLLFNLFSSVDIQIETPDGKKIGKNFETDEILNEVDLAFYSGFDNEDEFITIPNYQAGKYKIKTQGTENGDFEIQIVSFKEDENGEVEDAVLKTIQENTLNEEEKEFSLIIEDPSEITIQSHGASEDDEEVTLLEESAQTESSNEENNASSSDSDNSDEDPSDTEKQSHGVNDEEDPSDTEKQSHGVNDSNEVDKEDEQVEINDKTYNNTKNIDEVNQSEKPAVKGAKTKKNPWGFVVILASGALALILTWTIGRKKEESV